MPDPFLRNGSVSMFPLLDGRFLVMQKFEYNNVFHVVRAERL
jgi:hypothetical protein